MRHPELFPVLVTTALAASFFRPQESRPSEPDLQQAHRVEQHQEIPYIPLPEQTPEPTHTIYATGDISLARLVSQKMERYNDFRWPVRYLRDELVDGDILINLESPIFDPCAGSPSPLVLCVGATGLYTLSYLDVDVVNIANNHAYDYGDKGLWITENYLAEEGIPVSDQDTLVILERNRISFGFIGFNTIKQTANTDILSDEEILTRIGDAAGQVDVLIVSFHWGNEYETHETKYQQTLGRAAIDRGASVIIGNHPHVIQPIEEYHDGVIFYSLGNTIFDQMWNTAVRTGLIAKMHFRGKKLISYGTLQTRIEDYGQPTFITSDSQ